MGTNRLFIALPVDDTSVIAGLDEVRREFAHYSGFLKPVPPVNYHITLKFFGDVEENDAQAMVELFNSIQGLSMIKYSVNGLGAFPSATDPAVIWARLDCDTAPLMGLLHGVEEFGRRFGFLPERKKFVPHLTLARVRRGAAPKNIFRDLLMKFQDSAFGDSYFKELVLFESFLRKSGAEYRKIAALKLL